MSWAVRIKLSTRSALKIFSCHKVDEFVIFIRQWHLKNGEYLRSSIFVLPFYGKRSRSLTIMLPVSKKFLRYWRCDFIILYKFLYICILSRISLTLSQLMLYIRSCFHLFQITRNSLPPKFCMNLNNNALSSSPLFSRPLHRHIYMLRGMNWGLYYICKLCRNYLRWFISVISIFLWISFNFYLSNNFTPTVHCMTPLSTFFQSPFFETVVIVWSTQEFCRNTPSKNLIND